MALIEKELNKDILKTFIDIVEQDKKRRVPVIKFIRRSFLLELVEKFKQADKNISFIGITGESASGKSTFVRTIIKKIREIEQNKNKKLLNFISSDNYFNDISGKIKQYGSFDNFLVRENYNPDAPESFQLDLMRKHILQLAQNEGVYIPEYKVDGTGISVKDAIFIDSAPIIMAEGIAVFYPNVRDLFDIRFYVEVDEETRVKRYVKRAIECRQQTEQSALEQYETINKSAQIYLRPQRKYADVIINGKAEIEDFVKITEDFSRCF